MHVVDCAYPFDPDTFQDNDDLIFQAVGKFSESSGAGFGFRDHQFEYGYKVDAEWAQKELRKLTLNWEYCDIYQERWLP